MYVSESVLETTQYPVFLYVLRQIALTLSHNKNKNGSKYFCSAPSILLCRTINYRHGNLVKNFFVLLVSSVNHIEIRCPECLLKT